MYGSLRGQRVDRHDAPHVTPLEKRQVTAGG